MPDCLSNTLTEEKAKASPSLSTNQSRSSLLRGAIREYWSLKEMGIECNSDKPKVIIKVTPGTPAWEQGLKPGDQLLKMEQQGQLARITISRDNKIYQAVINYQLAASVNNVALNKPFSGEVRQDFINSGVNHADRLPPLPAGLQIGASYNKNDLPKCNCGGTWFRIPAWFAGTWNTSDEMAESKTHYDFRSGRSTESHYRFRIVKTGDLYGVAADKTGQIWHYPCVPYTGEQVVDGIHYIDTETEELPINISENAVVLRDRYFDVEVDSGNRIKSLYQYENITTFKQQYDGYLRLDDSIKTFTADGSPLYLDTSTYSLKRAQNFKPVYDFFGNNLVEMFIQYLKLNGMNNLIPGSK